MRRAILVLVMVVGLAGCAGATAPGTNVDGGGGALSAIKYIHDDAHHVGCWIYAGSNGSITCLPDKDYQP